LNEQVSENLNMASKSRRGWIPLTVVLLLAGLWFGNYEYRVAPIRFDAAQWATADRDDPLHRRARMADWLLAGGALTGKTRAEIVSLLGPPLPPGSFRDWEFSYDLGSERGLASVDHELLVLRFDSTGHANEARILSD
jgi:hypothetical protein